MAYRISETPEYQAWERMKYRCSSEHDPDWADYGGRGITVCDRWLKFENFYADMGPRPGLGYSIDRLDNDGNYEKDNCEWHTAKEQADNRRARRGGSSAYRGVYLTPRGKWVAEGVRDAGRYAYLGAFTDELDAAKAHDKAVFEVKGFGSWLNFPDEYKEMVEV
jgi:hypothetical protein